MTTLLERKINAFWHRALSLSAITLILLFTALGMVSLRYEIPYPYMGSAPFEFPLQALSHPNPLGISSLIRVIGNPGPYLSHSINYLHPFPRNAFEDAQWWASTYTGINELFITPPYLTGFRIYSERSIVGEWNDVILSTANEDFTRKIMERMSSLCDSPIFGKCDGEYGYTCTLHCRDGYTALDGGKFLAIAKKYGARYVVVEKTQKLDFDLAYENDGFRIYKVP
jgi:hypothetical protein